MHSIDSAKPRARPSRPAFRSSATRRSGALREDQVPLFWAWTGIILITLAGLLPRLWNLGGTAMWTDEMLTWLRMNAPLSDSFDSLTSVGNQMPFYYLVLRLLPQADPVWLRLPSVVFGLVDIVLVFYLVASLYNNRLLGLQVAALMAANPMHIILSRTARYYTILLALAIINLLCFVWLLRGKRSRGLWLGLGLSSMLSYLLHHTTLALPAAQFITLALAGRHQRPFFRAWSLVQVVAMLPLAGWLLLLLSQPFAPPSPYTGQGLTWRDLLISWQNIVMGFDGNWSWVLVPGLVCATLGLMAGIAYGVTRRPQQEELAVWLALAILPVLVLAVLAVTLDVSYRDRYFLVGMPAVLLLTGWGWQRYSALWRWLGFTIVLLTSVYLSWQVFTTGNYQRTDWHNATAYVMDHYQPGDIVLFEREIVRDIFAFYADAGRPTPFAPGIVAEGDADSIVRAHNAERIWVVARVRHEDLHRQGWTQDHDPFQPQLSPLSDWLRKRRAAILATTHFDGLIIFLMTGAEHLPSS
jgi:uncharacterized membrane protein